MSDVKCTVCGEPWDFWGAKHGDMAKWEYDLFRKGSGCPSCKGVDDNSYHPEQYSDVEFGDEDPIDRLHAYDDRLQGKTPKWVKPDDIVHWTCNGCGVKVITDVNNITYDGDAATDVEPEYMLPHDAIGNKWYNSHPYHNGCPEVEPYATFGEQVACEFCATICGNCDTSLSNVLQFNDIYVAGYAMPHPHDEYHASVCVSCHEELSNQESEER